MGGKGVLLFGAVSLVKPSRKGTDTYLDFAEQRRTEIYSGARRTPSHVADQLRDFVYKIGPNPERR